MTVEVGAFEALGISGVSLARGADVLGVRLACPHPALGLFDDKDVLLTLERIEQIAPAARYTRYSWRVPVTAAAIKRVAGFPRKSVNGPLAFDLTPADSVRVTLEWRQEGETALVRYTADKPLRVGLFVNGCFQPAEVADAVKTRCALRLGETTLQVALDGAIQQYWRIENRLQAEQVWAGQPVPDGRTMVLYAVELEPPRPLYVALHAQARTAAPADLVVDAPRLDQALATAAAEYERTRMRSGGLVAGAAEAVAGLAQYSRAYDAPRRRVQTIVLRSWSGPNSPGPTFGWDNFFTSYLASWEDAGLGAASLEHVVSVYGENGIVNGPAQRNLIIPIVYCQTLAVLSDEAVARRTWPAMIEFLRFWFADRGDGRRWRDGNNDGLIEQGASLDPAKVRPGAVIQNAMDESGYDDLAAYSAGFTEGRLGMLRDGVGFDWPSRTLTLSDLGQNCLYVASCRAMALQADRLDETKDAAWLRAEAERVAGRIRAVLLNPADGIFHDRRWDGSFSPVKTMTHFYPLLAGIATVAEQARLRAMLVDPRQFWGENLIPTVSRDDPAYCDGLDGRGNYWRGNCWPPTTYMVYLAIKEAGWDDLAAEYARRVGDQFMKYWRAHGHAYENYPPEGEVDHRFLYLHNWGGREMRYVWAGLMPLCALGEIFAPESVRPGLRFGNPHLKQEATWTGVPFAGARIAAVAGPGRTQVRFGDQWEFAAEPGVAVRSFRATAPGFAFTASAPQPVTVRLQSPALAAPVSVTGAGRILAVEPIASGVSFRLPAGTQEVALKKAG